MDGILNMHKAIGMTSHDVVARVRKLIKQRRVGHTGTLDPAASGVLPICVGQATRMAEYLSESGKAYEATITLGVVTDTYDAEGTVLRTANTDGITLDNLQMALSSFIGQQQQIPPRYSAIKIQGQPAYKRVRAGEEIELAARSVEITELRLLRWNSPQLTLAIECSKGTYIRSLAYDLGEKLGCGAHMSGLVRTRSGPFTLADSITLEQLAEAVEQQTVSHLLFPADKAVQHLPQLFIDDETVKHVLHGNAFQHNIQANEADALARVYDSAHHFLALATWDAEQQRWQPKKVFMDRLSN